MRSIKENRLILEHDAQWTKVKEVLVVLSDEHNITVVLPSRMKIPTEYFAAHNIDVVVAGGHGNVMVNRHHFDTEQMPALMNFSKPDVIWLEVPELVANYKSVCDIPIVATFEHFVDSYIWRQIEGFSLADIRVIPTKKLFRKFQQMVRGRLQEIFWTAVIDGTKIRYWHNFIAASDIKKNEVVIKRKWNFAPKVTKIIFPSRLSDYERTKWANFIECAEDLLIHGYDVEICNPSEVRRPDVISKLQGKGYRGNLIFHDTKMNREQWLQQIAEAHIAFMLYSFDDFYSVGAVELLASGVKLITLYSSFLDNIVDDNDQLVYVKAVDKETILEAFYQSVHVPLYEFKYGDIIDKISGEAWALKILETLEEAAKMRT
jgi:hypothetical protein